MVIGTATGMGNAATIVLSIVLAFFVGYSLAIRPILAGLLFWASLAFSLAVAFVVTVPVNRWLIGRGRGHAVMHAYDH